MIKHRKIFFFFNAKIPWEVCLCWKQAEIIALAWPPDVVCVCVFSSLNKQVNQWSILPKTSFFCLSAACLYRRFVFHKLVRCCCVWKNYYNRLADILMLKIHMTDSISEVWLESLISWCIDCGWGWCACSGILSLNKAPWMLSWRDYWSACVKYSSHTHFHSLCINLQTEIFPQSSAVIWKGNQTAKCDLLIHSVPTQQHWGRSETRSGVINRRKKTLDRMVCFSAKCVCCWNSHQFLKVNVVVKAIIQGMHLSSSRSFQFFKFCPPIYASVKLIKKSRCCHLVLTSGTHRKWQKQIWNCHNKRKKDVIKENTSQTRNIQVYVH